MAYFGIADSLQSSVTSANTKNIDAPGRAHIYITHAGFATERSRSRCPPSLHKQHNVTCFYASPGNIFWKAISRAHARFQKSIHFRQYSRYVDVACYLGWKRSACHATRTQHPVTVHIVCHCMYTCTATDWNPENIWEHLRTLGCPGTPTVLHHPTSTNPYSTPPRHAAGRAVCPFLGDMCNVSTMCEATLIHDQIWNSYLIING